MYKIHFCFTRVLHRTAPHRIASWTPLLPRYALLSNVLTATSTHNFSAASDIRLAPIYQLQPADHSRFWDHFTGLNEHRRSSSFSCQRMSRRDHQRFEVNVSRYIPGMLLLVLKGCASTAYVRRGGLRYPRV